MFPYQNLYALSVMYPLLVIMHLGSKFVIPTEDGGESAMIMSPILLVKYKRCESFPASCIDAKSVVRYRHAPLSLNSTSQEVTFKPNTLTVYLNEFTLHARFVLPLRMACTAEQLLKCSWLVKFDDSRAGVLI